MADGSKIEWTEATWNPLVGCTAVSPGCDHCYAARHASGRLSHLPLYAGLAKGGVFTGEVRLVESRLDEPLGWKRPRRIFVNSMSDLFHNAVPDEFIARVFVAMAAAKQHTFQLLTKRHGRMRTLLSSPGFQLLAGAAAFDFMQEHKRSVGWSWPLPNVWLGVSVENQHWADIRLPALYETPAAVRWLSCEPLLGPIRVPFIATVDACTCAGFPPYGHEPHCGTEPGPAWGEIHWVVTGGESGPGARPMHPDWARSLRDQCADAGVPFLFKQWGAWGPSPEAIKGRLLDGRTWDQYPEVTR